ncbi:Cytotoxic translational repressor of toxin-antitoxin stability system [Halapricum desulfuricans]|uniref:Cytotoxic translational repressor of toxin-antitoxin stability system n=1 Tax=Halapricum desulfuricans TaxID=2841257 RepID=A0A897NH78_9EURY|nr:Cytotoxic translational repressor of toxin-antitoxin stability system [Halapricum desulfuricans]
MGSTASDDEWGWALSPRADDQFAQLDSESKQRVTSKLDEVVSPEELREGEFDTLDDLQKAINGRMGEAEHHRENIRRGTERSSDRDAGSISYRTENPES